MVPTREIIVKFKDNTDLEIRLRFRPELSTIGDEILLDDVYKFTLKEDGTIDETGDNKINLPVKPNGSILYKYEILRAGAKNFGQFYLSAGDPTTLADLIAAGGAATQPVLDYIDEVISNLQTEFGEGLNNLTHSNLQNLDDDDHPQYLNDSRGDARYFQKTTNLVVSGNIEAKKIQFPFVSLDFADNPNGWDKSQYLYAEYYFYYRKGTEYFNFRNQYAEIEGDTFLENFNIIFDWENDFEADSIEIYRYDSISDEMGLLASLPPSSQQFIDDNSLPLDTNEAMPFESQSGNVICERLTTNNLNLTAPLPNISVTNGTINYLTSVNINATNITANGYFKSALNQPFLVWGTPSQPSYFNYAFYQELSNYSAPAGKGSGLFYQYLNVTSIGSGGYISNYSINLGLQNLVVAGEVINAYFSASASGTSNITTLIGNDTLGGAISGTVGTLIGFRGTATPQFSAIITTAIGGLFRVRTFSSTALNTGECGVFQIVRGGSAPTNLQILRGISIRGWDTASNPQTSYGIFIDNTIDRGIVNKYCIYSESTSDSRFLGNIEIADPNKNYIVRSPNNNRWKLVVDNSGNLTAQAA